MEQPFVVQHSPHPQTPLTPYPAFANYPLSPPLQPQTSWSINDAQHLHLLTSHPLSSVSPDPVLATPPVAQCDGDFLILILVDCSTSGETPECSLFLEPSSLLDLLAMTVSLIFCLLFLCPSLRCWFFGVLILVLLLRLVF